MISAVYAIITPNGQYIGGTKNYRVRCNLHRSRLKLGTHQNHKLQMEYNRYRDQFKFQILIICLEKDLHLYEQIAMNALKPEHNIYPYAGKGFMPRPLFKGHKHSDESKAKMSKANKGKQFRLGKFLSNETKAKISSANRGKALSEIHKDKLRKHRHTKETRAKMAISQKRRRAIEKQFLLAEEEK